MSEHVTDDELAEIEAVLEKWRSEPGRSRTPLVDRVMTMLLKTSAEVRRLRQQAAEKPEMTVRVVNDQQTLAVGFAKEGEPLVYPPPLAWTKELPTVPGHYGWREEPDCLDVVKVREGMGGALYDDSRGEPVALVGGEWCGPIIFPD